MTPTTARVLLFTSVAGWAVVFVANHELLAVFRPLEILSIRFLGVSLAFLVVMAVVPSKRPRLDASGWGWLTLAGILAIPGSQLLVLTGQQFLSPTLSGLVVTSSPAFAAVIAYRFLHERMEPRQVAGIVVALVGVAIVVVFATGTGTDLVIENPWGASLLIIGQVTWAGYTVIARKLAQEHDPFTMIAVAFTLGSIALVPWMPGAVRLIPELTRTEAWWMAHLIIGGTLIPHVIWFTVLRHLQANETSVAMYLVPFYTMIASFAILGERLTLIGIIGGLAIIAGVALSQTRRPAAPTTPPVDP